MQTVLVAISSDDIKPPFKSTLKIWQQNTRASYGFGSCSHPTSLGQQTSFRFPLLPSPLPRRILLSPAWMAQVSGTEQSEGFAPLLCRA